MVSDVIVDFLIWVKTTNGIDDYFNMELYIQCSACIKDISLSVNGFTVGRVVRVIELG